jgi:GTP cyclohydrolase I
MYTNGATIVALDEVSREHVLPNQEKSEEQKIKLISDHFREIMKIIGLDIEDDSLINTPRRVAKMYIKEIFSGLNPANKPRLTLFDNKYKYNKMVLEKDITLYSFCEHHFLPITGKAHVAYISSGKIIGLSKLNRLVQYYSSKPQVQEKLTEEIATAIKQALHTEDVAVMIDAVHFCVASRGIKDTNSRTVTSHFSGKFKNEETKTEFLLSVK